MPTTIFFSWQADTPTREGRNFIERALQAAVERLGSDASIEHAVRDGLEVDKDTKGVAGQPPIVDTIFRKIDAAAIFVPDLTFVGTRLDKRPTPNPNVLIEYGWALKSLGHSRVVPVMNAAFGAPSRETLPFNLGHLRFPTTYNLPDSANNEIRASEREKLAKVLEHQLRSIFDSENYRASLPKPPSPSSFPAAEPKSGQARFRFPGEALGVTADILFGASVEVRLTDGPAIWLRLMPFLDQGRSWPTKELRKVGVENGFTLGPLMMQHYRGFDYLRAEDGFGIFPVFDDKTNTVAVAFAFHSGEIWSIDTGRLAAARMESERSGRKMGIPFIEHEMTAALTRYAQFLAGLGLKPPYRWIAGIEGIKGAGLYYPPPPGHMFIEQGPKGTSVDNIITKEGSFAEGSNPNAALKPFFEKLFESCGPERPSYLDSVGDAH